ncbi:MAG: hypothetical protein L6R42_004164 [Xanthoria sp. 1 TBL-2021]|nr:MAG: hypothetical protein L6R42_004164 [Xanthoria sp. 1 TBL-2021]
MVIPSIPHEYIRDKLRIAGNAGAQQPPQGPPTNNSITPGDMTWASNAGSQGTGGDAHCGRSGFRGGRAGGGYRGGRAGGHGQRRHQPYTYIPQSQQAQQYPQFSPPPPPSFGANPAPYPQYPQAYQPQGVYENHQLGWAGYAPVYGHGQYGQAHYGQGQYQTPAPPPSLPPNPYLPQQTPPSLPPTPYQLQQTGRGGSKWKRGRGSHQTPVSAVSQQQLGFNAGSQQTIPQPTPTNIQSLQQTSSPAAPPPIAQRTLPALTPELVLWITRHEKYRDDKSVDENFEYIIKWEVKQARLERKNREKDEKEREREEREREKMKALKAKIEVLEARQLLRERDAEYQALKDFRDKFEAEKAEKEKAEKEKEKAEKEKEKAEKEKAEKEKEKEKAEKAEKAELRWPF